MKKWKKPLSVLLALVMACSAMSVTFMASAKEDVQYPDGVTEEKVTNTISYLDNAALGLLKPETGIYTNYTLNLVLETYINLIESLTGGSMSLTPNGIWMYTTMIQPNPLEANRNDEDWTNVNFSSLKWIENGNKEQFYDTLYILLRPLGLMLSMLTMEDAVEPDTSLGIPAPLYRYTFYPIFSALGLPDIITPEEYFESHAIGVVQAQEDCQNAMNTFAEAIGAFEEAMASGNQEQIDTARAELPDAVNAFLKIEDAAYAPMLKPLLALVENLLDAPLTVLLDKLPQLDTLVKSGALDFVFPMLFPDAEKPADLVGLLNLVLGSLPIIPDADGNPQPIGIELSDFDASALKDNSPEERFLTVLRWLIDNIKVQKNLDVIAGLVGDNEQIASLLALVPTLDTDALVTMVVAMANPEPPTDEPTTGEEPTTDDTTISTQPSTNGTTPADSTGTTSPADPDDTPETGDAVMGALAAVSLAAAVAFVMTRKKSH